MTNICQLPICLTQILQTKHCLNGLEKYKWEQKIRRSTITLACGRLFAIIFFHSSSVSYAKVVFVCVCLSAGAKRQHLYQDKHTRCCQIW